MSTDAERPREIPPEEALALAEAMAYRSLLTNQISAQIKASLSGEMHVPDPEEVQRAELVGRSAMLLAQIENPATTYTAEERVDAKMGSAGYRHHAQTMNEATPNEIELDEQNTRASIIRTIEEIQRGNGYSDADIADEFARRLAAAREVATLHDTDVASVYSQDDLYFEAERRAFTPEEDGHKIATIIDGLSDDVILNSVIRSLELLLPEEILEEATAEELAELSMELQLDPGIRELMAGQVEFSREVLRQTCAYFFVKTYGPGAFAKLPVEQLFVVQPRLPLVPEIFADIEM